MKSSKNNNSDIPSLFGRFNKPIEQKIGDIVSDKQIRHVEKKVELEFLDEKKKDNTVYGETEDVKETWGLDGNSANVVGARRHFLVRFAIAAVITGLIIAGIFVVLPAILPGFFKNTNIELFVQKNVDLMYEDEDYRVVKEKALSIYDSPDITSDRIAQVLYNELVTITGSQELDGFIKIETSDGISGYVKADSLIADTKSVEPDLHDYKLIVSDPSKNVMTHASNGTLITKVYMNTVLYADVKRDGVYQVYLPGGEKGWIGSSGVIELAPRAEIQAVSSRYFVSSVTTFVNAMFIDDGCSIDGISVNGAVYVCSSINGIKVPRTMEGQSELGQEVELKYDAVTGELEVNSIIPGDIVFLRAATDSEDSKRISEMAVCTDTGTLYMISKAKTTCRLYNFESGDSICHRIVSVRRIFKTE